MTEIKKLDDKYLVIKKEDLDRYFSQFTRGVFTTKEEQKLIDQRPFKTVIEVINEERERQGKKPNKYVILNLDDKIDINSISQHLQNIIHFPEKYPDKIKVKDIAVDLVNAILKAKGD